MRQSSTLEHISNLPSKLRHQHTREEGEEEKNHLAVRTIEALWPMVQIRSQYITIKPLLFITWSHFSIDYNPFICICKRFLCRYIPVKQNQEEYIQANMQQTCKKMVYKERIWSKMFVNPHLFNIYIYVCDFSFEMKVYSSNQIYVDNSGWRNLFWINGRRKRLWNDIISLHRQQKSTRR